ncbi:DUF3008 family protein [Celeribacter sp.]|uniref:DUF3008 family protein n=1 Tax=Celeribacter sp. TaxID=1890673 RepID=UPI003A8E0C11
MTFMSKLPLDAVGVALAAKRGERTSHDLSGASKQLFENLTEGELEEMTVRAPQGYGPEPRG